MKLRNKKTGEIVDDGYVRETHDFQFDGQKHVLAVFKGNGHRPPERVSGAYYSLAELNEEWEDYGEPKEDGLENIITLAEAYSNYDSERYPKEIVEKLKVWKKLKDKGFRFDGWDENHHNLGIIEFSFPNVEVSVYDFDKDLDLLFGGENGK